MSKYLVAGAGGFIGGHLVSSLLNDGHEVVCADIKPAEYWFQYFNECENFSLDLKSYDNCLKVSKNVDFIIGDVRDKNSISYAMKGVDIVFHAAALKQVPSCEFFPDQAAATNIIGSKNVFSAAIDNEVSKVVALSTDKAVMPINSMGMSKALMEKILLSKARKASHKTVFSIVRYGNVIYSRGSVLPLFVEQILNKKLITISDNLKP